MRENICKQEKQRMRKKERNKQRGRERERTDRTERIGLKLQKFLKEKSM